jgi:metal-responsive CopG/Arc/MetJ family transcriptional regulator
MARKIIAICLRPAVVEALDELAEREGVSRSLLIHYAINLLFKEKGVELYVKDQPRKESKTVAKVVESGKGVLLLAPR